MTIIKDSIRVVILSFLVSLSVYFVFAQGTWTEPSQAPPGGNAAAPLNTGSTGQSKSGGLILNTGGAVNGLIVNSGATSLGGQLNMNNSDVGFSTPARNALYKENIIKAWVNFVGEPCSGAGNTCVINDSFNVEKVAQNAQGHYTIYWDQDFANANYAFSGLAKQSGAGAATVLVLDGIPLVGSINVQTMTVGSAAPTNANPVTIIAIGDQ